MDETSPKKWRHLAVFIVGTFVSVGVLLYLAEIFFPNTASSMLPRNSEIIRRFFNLPNFATGGYRSLYDTSTRTITLSMNQSYELEGIRITYRGLGDKDRFDVDVHILSFDRETSFRYRVPIDKAKEAFHLARKKFRLISARRNRLVFRRQSD